MPSLFVLVIIIGLLPAIPTLIALVHYALGPVFKLLCEVIVLVVLVLITAALALIVRILHLLFLEFNGRTFINPIGGGDHDDASDGNSSQGNNGNNSDHGGSRGDSSHRGSSSSWPSDNSNLLRGRGSGRVGLALAANPTIVAQDTASSVESSEGMGGGVTLRNGHDLVAPITNGKSCHLNISNAF
jgi:hypothetical protein